NRSGHYNLRLGQRPAYSMTRYLRLVLISGFAALAAVGPVRSEEWPQRPVKIVVPFAAGGNADETARLVAFRLSEAFGQQVLVENGPGATGAIAGEFVARAPADGYTLLFASLPLMAIMPAMTKAPFDPVKDFVPVSAIATNPVILVAHPSLPVKSVA